MRLQRFFALGLLAALAAVLLVPFAATLVKSLLAMDAARPEQLGNFVGLANYVALFTGEPEFWISLQATLRFIGVAALQCAAALSLALWLRLLWPSRLPVALFVVLILPLAVPPTLVALMGRFYLNDQVGLATEFLHAVGLLGANHAPLGDQAGAWLWVSIIDAWTWLPFTALLFYFSLALVPQRHRDMSRMDRLGYWPWMTRIVMPQIWGVLVIITLLRLLEAYRAYDIAQVLTGGGPGTSTLFIGLYANRITFVQQRYGLGAAHLVLIELAAYVLIFLLIGRVQAFRQLLRGHTR